MRILENLRSLCFGAAIGSLLMALFFSKYPQVFPSAFSLEMAFSCGAAIGGAIHRLIELFIRALLRPIYDTVSLYLKLSQIVILQRFFGHKFMPEVMQKELIEALMKSYFINRNLNRALEDHDEEKRKKLID
ncbi:MAG: hypothetical protein WCB68_09485 [Pyrinomonadaceae bacterium]